MQDNSSEWDKCLSIIGCSAEWCNGVLQTWAHTPQKFVLLRLKVVTYVMQVLVSLALGSLLLTDWRTTFDSNLHSLHMAIYLYLHYYFFLCIFHLYPFPSHRVIGCSIIFCTISIVLIFHFDYFYKWYSLISSNSILI